MATFVRPPSAFDTIVAESTPRGAGAIAIVRLSGPSAVKVARALMAPGAEQAPTSHRLVRRRLHDGDGKLLDDAMVAHMLAPNSVTGEDVVELHLHGSPAVVEAVLRACLAAGARQALPGEFTRRAFLSGKLDLSQVEAVGALVSAQNEQQRQAALRLLQGELGAVLRPVCRSLEGVVAAWRASLDFPDEVDAAPGMAAALAALAAAQAQLQALTQRAQPLLVAQPEVVLLGGVNVGKSTLLNALAGEERALVDASPGTTRDAVALQQEAANVRFTVWDTAGLRPGAQALEARGMAHSRQRAAAATLRLWLTGAQATAWPDAALGEVHVLGSQRDRTDGAVRAGIEQEARRRGLPFIGWICAPTGEGIAALRGWLGERLRPQQGAAAPGLVVARRHQGLMQRAHEGLGACLAAAAAALPLDCLLAELEDAAAALGEVLGQDVDAAVLDRIFADFCLGK